MSGYDWEPDRYEDRERERAWEQADRDEHAELAARDRLERDVGERAAVRFPPREAEAEA